MDDIGINRQFLETDEEEACRLIFDRYYDTIFKTVSRMMWDHPDPAVDADDITSQTFIRAFERRKEIQEPEKLLGWLRTTARNLAIDTIRSANREKKSVSFESLDNLPVRDREAPFASSLAEADTKQAEADRYLLMQLLCLLPDRDREIVELMLDELTPKEIAETISSTPGAVQKRWERLLVWLRPIAHNLHELIDCLSEEDDRRIMERYLDGHPLSEIAEAIGISRSAVEQRVKRVIAAWKKAVRQNSEDPVSAMAKNER